MNGKTQTCISMHFSGVRKMSPSAYGDWKRQPSSEIFINLLRDTIWNPPESVSTALGHFIKPWTPPHISTISAPGWQPKWYVLDSINRQPVSSSSAGITDFIAPLVPTGIKMGVVISTSLAITKQKDFKSKAVSSCLNQKLTKRTSCLEPKLAYASTGFLTSYQFFVM